MQLSMLLDPVLSLTLIVCTFHSWISNTIVWAFPKTENQEKHFKLTKLVLFSIDLSLSPGKLNFSIISRRPTFHLKHYPSFFFFIFVC